MQAMSFADPSSQRGSAEQTDRAVISCSKCVHFSSFPYSGFPESRKEVLREHRAPKELGSQRRFFLISHCYGSLICVC